MGGTQAHTRAHTAGGSTACWRCPTRAPQGHRICTPGRHTGAEGPANLTTTRREESATRGQCGEEEGGRDKAGLKSPRERRTHDAGPGQLLLVVPLPAGRQVVEAVQVLQQAAQQRHGARLLHEPRALAEQEDDGDHQLWKEHACRGTGSNQVTVYVGASTLQTGAQGPLSHAQKEVPPPAPPQDPVPLS